MSTEEVTKKAVQGCGFTLLILVGVLVAMASFFVWGFSPGAAGRGHSIFGLALLCGNVVGFLSAIWLAMSRSMILAFFVMIFTVPLTVSIVDWLR